MLKYFKILLLCFASPLLIASTLADLEIYTEDYPPFNIKNSDGINTGISIDLLDAVHKELGSSKTRKDYFLINWARGYTAIQTPGKQAMLFSTTRSPEREKLFKWAGPIIDTTVSVFGKKGTDISIKSPEDLKKHTFSVIRGGICEISLNTAGVPEQHIDKLSELDQVLKKVQSGRSDLFVYERTVARWLMKKYGFSQDEFVELFPLVHGDLYYAFNLSVPDETVAAYQKAIDKLTKNPDFIKNLANSYLQ